MADLTHSIATERLLLRPFTLADVDAVHAYHSLKAVAHYQMWEPRTRDQVAAEIETWTSQSLDAGGVCRAVILKADGKLIGDITLMHRDIEARQAEIGFSFSPEYGGQGYATEAAIALMAFGFGPLKLHRIFGRCDARNTPSWRVMERIGMRREAHFREHAIFKGEWDEEFYYAMLHSEWVAGRMGGIAPGSGLSGRN
ncbi:GNAT family protein [Hoeflea sp. AS60]|uniref:GNAT family N-acetyltransferase n=1 Tax=Hoeflea sp. AS60 TaxID=3135780 RepID=UPI00317F7A7E